MRDRTLTRSAARSALFVIGVAAFLLGCKLTKKTAGDGGAGGAGGDAASGGGGSEGGASCGERPVCDECRSCAVDGPCADVTAACLADSACVAIDQCMTLACDGTEADCLALCESQNPTGSTTYRAARSCIDCEVCAAPCASTLCGS